MPSYRNAGSPVEKTPHKFDGFKIEAVGDKSYKKQEGSGRAAVFNLITVGQTVKTWTEKCAKAGHDTAFAVNSLMKHQDGATAAFKFSAKNDKGETYEEVKKRRNPRIKKEGAAPKAKAKAKAKAKSKPTSPAKKKAA